jgi:hypothetical protein
MKCEYWTKLSKMVPSQSVEGRSKKTLNHRSIDPKRTGAFLPLAD